MSDNNEKSNTYTSRAKASQQIRETTQPTLDIIDQFTKQFAEQNKAILENLNAFYQLFPFSNQTIKQARENLIKYLSVTTTILLDNKWVPFIDERGDLDILIQIIETQNSTNDPSDALNEYMQSTFADEFYPLLEESIVSLEQDTVRKQIYFEALESHKNEKYASCIFLIVPFYERLIKEITNEKQSTIKNSLKILFTPSDSPNSIEYYISNEELLEFFNQYVFYSYYEDNPTHVIQEDTPSRHVFMHGNLQQYPTKKASLNTLLLLNMLLIIKSTENITV